MSERPVPTEQNTIGLAGFILSLCTILGLPFVIGLGIAGFAGVPADPPGLIAAELYLAWGCAVGVWGAAVVLSSLGIARSRKRTDQKRYGLSITGLCFSLTYAVIIISLLIIGVIAVGE